jgi:hypothetical protein
MRLALGVMKKEPPKHGIAVLVAIRDNPHRIGN